MADEQELIRQTIRTPRSAAVAGIVFAVLLITSEVLVWVYVPSVAVGDDSPQAGAIARRSKQLTLAMNLRPFSGIAFLWFVGVVRNRLGSQEDPVLYHGISGQRSALRCHDVYRRCSGGSCADALSKKVRRPPEFGFIRFGAGRGLSYHVNLCDQDGRSVHDIDLYDL